MSVTSTTDSALSSEHRVAVASRTRADARLVAVLALNCLTHHVVCPVRSFTLRRLWYRHLLGIRFGRHAGIHLGCYVWLYSLRGIRRNRSCIGENSRINRACTVDLHGGLIRGDNVSVSAEAMLLTSAGMANSEAAGEGRPIVVHDNVWIGVRALAMPGVTMGCGAVVSAGAVVTPDVPALTVVFGSPARPVGTRTREEAQYVLDGTLPLFE